MSEDVREHDQRGASELLVFMTALRECIQTSFAGLRAFIALDDLPGSRIADIASWPSLDLYKSAGPLLAGPANLSLHSKVRQKTTQGSVYFLVCDLKGAVNVVVAKLDPVTPANLRLWFPNHPAANWLQGRDGVWHGLIAPAFMDVLCAELFSRDVQRGLTPHFPLLGASGVARVRRTGLSPGTPCVVILMEYFAASMADTLSRCSDAHEWFSAILQVCCGLFHANSEHGLVHNDCHAANVMRRQVKAADALHYVSNNHLRLSVPTFGSQYAIIDFGRSRVNARGCPVPMTSGEFGRGVYRDLHPDNSACDVARLAMSLEDLAIKHVDPDAQGDLVRFLRDCCQPDEGENLLDGLRRAERMPDCAHWSSIYTEEYTKQRCSRMTPEWAIRALAPRFAVTPHDCDPQCCRCYPLRLSL